MNLETTRVANDLLETSAVKKHWYEVNGGLSAYILENYAIAYSLQDCRSSNVAWEVVKERLSQAWDRAYKPQPTPPIMNDSTTRVYTLMLNSAEVQSDWKRTYAEWDTANLAVETRIATISNPYVNWQQVTDALHSATWPTATQPTKETIMNPTTSKPFLQTMHLVNGTELSELTDEQVMYDIIAIENKINQLNGIHVYSKTRDKTIKSLTKDVQKLSKLLDKRNNLPKD